MRAEAACDWYRGRLWARRAQLFRTVRQRCFGLGCPRLCGFPLATVAEAFMVLHRIKRQPDLADRTTGTRKAHHTACHTLRKAMWWYFVSHVGIADKTCVCELGEGDVSRVHGGPRVHCRGCGLEPLQPVNESVPSAVRWLARRFQCQPAKVAVRGGRTRKRNCRVRGRHEGVGRAPVGESGEAQARDSGRDVFPLASDTDTDAFAHGLWCCIFIAFWYKLLRCRIFRG